MKKLLILIAVFILVGCGGSTSKNHNVRVTPPAESLLGTYELRSFGLYSITLDVTVVAETTYYPWSGTMTVDPWEITRKVLVTEGRYSTFVDYIDTTTLDSIGSGRNPDLFIDGMFVILHYGFADYSIGDKRWYQCYKYEYWEKVSD
jgi:hypothetical protein